MVEYAINRGIENIFLADITAYKIEMAEIEEKIKRQILSKLEVNPYIPDGYVYFLDETKFMPDFQYTEWGNQDDIWITKDGQHIPIKNLKTSHIANILGTIQKYGTGFLSQQAVKIGKLIEEFEGRRDVKPEDFNKYANAVSILEEEQNMTQIYNVRVQSSFILTQNQVKAKLGTGYKVLEVSAEKESSQVQITDVDSAMENIVLAGYRALARAHHPDLGGDTETMVILNRTKKELLDLLKEIKG